MNGLSVPSNELHVVVALSRQRPRVRVPSSPPFFSIPFTELSCSLLAEVCPAADHGVDSVF